MRTQAIHTTAAVSILAVLAVVTLASNSRSAVLTAGDPRCAEVEREWKSEEEQRTWDARKRIAANLKRLGEASGEELDRVIQQLGEASDGRAVEPLVAFLENDKNPAGSRAKAVNALDQIATSPARAANAQEMVLKLAIPAIERALKADNAALRRTSADFLYRAGRRRIAGPVLLEALRAGDRAGFSAFSSARSEGSVNATTTFNPCAKSRVDRDAIPLLVKAGGSKYPGNIRILAAQSLQKAGETKKALAILRRVMVEAADFESRLHAMDESANIGTDEAWKVVEEATQIVELKSAAESRLRYRREKK